MKIVKKIKSKIKTRRDKFIFFGLFGVMTLGLLAGTFYVLSDNQPEQQAQVQQQQVEEEKQPEVVVPEPVVEEKPVEVAPKVEPKPTPEPESQWPVTYSTTEASSITVVVNKKHKLPSTYVPDLTDVTGGQMRPEAAQAMTSLLFKANEAGVGMKIISSYRSYNTQVSTYQKWVNLQGQAEADRGSARPGHSEHQTGLSADLSNPDGSCNLLACFGTGAQGVWLANNAHTYGFIIRYPEGKESLTGYQYEPWHVRYVGVDTATAIYQSGLTMDQYYGVEAGGY